MTEWHIAPDYIMSNWTEELLNLMVEKLNDRKKREVEAIRHNGSNEVEQVDDSVLLSRMGIKVKKVKHGD